ncbi:MAG: hypothetical protein QT00_C0002G0348 [archaeon GW2011_AR5]|nr:MAG: hypothetical protein QT00_C0002G0348 [archaeon GW2011_AR5]
MKKNNGKQKPRNHYFLSRLFFEKKKIGKGDTSISEIMYTMMSLLFLLLGVVLLVSIAMSTIDPYDQIAFANVEKLRASMDEACFTGSPVTVNNFQLPQNTPKFTSLISVMPIWLIRTNGDPNFVLYYESFPAGDATGWEIYQGMENRLITHLPAGYDNRLPADVKTYSDSIEQLWNTRVVGDEDVELTSKKLEGVIVNNVVIGSKRSDFYYGPNSAYGGSGGSRGAGPVDTGPGGTLAALSKFGEWRDLVNPDSENPVASEGDNAFIFNNYKGLTSFEKSAIKYAPCGDNSLCLKTRTGVYKYPLRQCSDIKYIEMKYDARDERRYIFEGVLGVAVLAVGAALILPSGAAVASGTALSAIPTATPIATTAGLYVAEGVTFTAVPAATGSGLVVGEVVGVAGSGSAFTLTGALSWFGRGILKLSSKVLGKSWKVLGRSWRFCKTCTIFGVGYASEKIGEFLGGVFLSYKVQDFNLASDCSIEQMKIEKVPCDQMECENAVNYPIYQYGGDGKLHEVGTHFTCLEKIGTDIQDTSAIPLTGFNGGQCMRITVEDKPDGFCWTFDPYRDDWLSDTQGIARAFGLSPINENTAYISGDASRDAVVLKYYPQGDLESWKEFFERRLSWGWPG